MAVLFTHVGIRSLVRRACVGSLGLLLLVCSSQTLAADADEVLAYGIGPNPATYTFDYSGTAILLMVDSDVVRGWLPAQLTLGPCDLRDCPARHPVLLVLGTQSNFARHTRITVRPSFGRYYHESFVIVPYLHYADEPAGRPISYYARLYLNNARGTELGQRLFGWPKLIASITSNDAEYEIRAPESGALLSVRFDEASRKTFAPNEAFARIEAILAQPTVLLHRGWFRPHNMQFAIRTDALTSVDARLDIADGFMPNLPAGEYSLKGLADDALGVVQFSARVYESRLD